jgi:hypothetical protein
VPARLLMLPTRSAPGGGACDAGITVSLLHPEGAVRLKALRACDAAREMWGAKRGEQAAQL